MCTLIILYLIFSSLDTDSINANINELRREERYNEEIRRRDERRREQARLLADDHDDYPRTCERCTAYIPRKAPPVQKRPSKHLWFRIRTLFKDGTKQEIVGIQEEEK